MALIKRKEIKKMDYKSRIEKIKELRFELVKSSVGANKSTAKTKEIKKTIARLLTFNAANPAVKKT